MRFSPIRATDRESSAALTLSAREIRWSPNSPSHAWISATFKRANTGTTRNHCFAVCAGLNAEPPSFCPHSVQSAIDPKTTSSARARTISFPNSFAALALLTQSGTALARCERMSDVAAVADRSRPSERRQSGCPLCRKRGDAFRVRAEGGRTTIEYRCRGCGSEWTAQWTDSSRLLSAKPTKAHEQPPH